MRKNYTRFHIDHTAESPLCRMCGSKEETVAHVGSECGKLAQTEYKGRHDNVPFYRVRSMTSPQNEKKHGATRYPYTDLGVS